jgi:RNA polymerase sigma factor (sigma-70 family)
LGARTPNRGGEAVDKLATLFKCYPTLCRQTAIRALGFRQIAPKRFGDFIEDLLQGAFLRIWKWLQNEPDRYAELSSDGALPWWFSCILYYACLDEHKRENHLTPRQLSDDQAAAHRDRGKSPDAILIEEEEKHRVREALRILDKRSRKIVEQRNDDGFTLQEIAKEYGVSHTRIRQIYREALEKLRAYLTD